MVNEKKNTKRIYSSCKRMALTLGLSCEHIQLKINTNTKIMLCILFTIIYPLLIYVGIHNAISFPEQKMATIVLCIGYSVGVIINIMRSNWNGGSSIRILLTIPEIYFIAYIVTSLYLHFIRVIIT